MTPGPPPGLPLPRCRCATWIGAAVLGLALAATGAAHAAGATPVTAAVTTATADTEAERLIRHIDHLWRGESSAATMTMTVRTQRYERSMTMDAWSRGKDHSLVIIREPVKDRDVATLKAEGNIWNYLPKINRVSKVPASLMSGSWMGSHFTNDDLVKDSSFEADYRSTLSFRGQRDGREVIEITSTARPDAPVVWGQVITVMDAATLAPLSSRYLDEAGRLVRTLRFDKPQRIGERIVPMRLHLQPEDKPDESTVIEYSAIQFGVPLAPNFFSLQNLQQRR